MAVRTTIRVFRHMRKRSAITTPAGRSRPGYTRVRTTSSSRGSRKGAAWKMKPGRPPRGSRPGVSLAPCGSASPGALWLERIHAEEGAERGRPPARSDCRQIRAVGDVERRMVEGRLLEAHAIVGERDHECHQGVLLSRAQPERADLAVREPGAEVAAAIVEVHHLAQRG